MAKFWKDLVLPIAIAGAVLAQTAGVDATRAARVRAWFPQTQRDTVIVADTSALSPLDSLAAEEDFDLFEEKQDTTPKVFARDTMRVPDSLQFSDPFLYQWYVAVKDSLTHRIVVDSLKEEGDSLLWPRIDSLYLADSAFVATEKFNRWYASLSKAERKRYDFEHYKLPVIQHRQDSILKRKDSLKHIKDSIRQNTPRILETAFLPDSLYYKRLVAWRHNRLYNSVEVFEWDTTANYHYNDYPFMRKDVGASWLGMPGSPVQSFNYFRRDEERSVNFYQPVESWTYTPENLTQFNTKTPYTELEYSGNLFNSKTTAADNYRIFTTQNILPSLNVALQMNRWGGAGTLKNEEMENRSYFVAGNYTGKKYLAHGGLIYNKITRQESGGVQDTKWIRDTVVDVREIEVNLAAATNRYKKFTLFYDQSYRIPFEFIEKLKHRGDTTWVPADTLNTNMTTGFIGTSSEFTTYSKKYVDNVSDPLSNFYNGVFNINPSKSYDSLRVMRLENRLFVRLQPWHEDAVVSKIEGGLGHRYQNFYLQQPNEVLYKPQNSKWSSFYTYAGVEGKVGRYVKWDATGIYHFAGKEVNDFSIDANAELNLYPFRRQPKSPMTLRAHFETSLKEPEFYHQHFYSNHYKWENNFGKISTTKLEASFSVPKWELSAHAGYALLANNIYYDTLGIVRQNPTAMSVFSAGITKNFTLGIVHLDNSALFQASSNQDVLPLPMLAVNLRWYLQFNIVDPKVLKMQLGINAHYNTLWYAPAYNPVAGVFMNQKQEQYGNCPTFDIFANLQWKKACIFLRFENAGRGWPKDNRDYFTAHRYIAAPASFKFGICWPFYPRLGAAKTLSERASSGGMGGGNNGGGSGLGGGLGNALGGAFRSNSN